jgi:hypothetical protein
VLHVRSPLFETSTAGDHSRLDKLDHVSGEIKTFDFRISMHVELNPAGSPAVYHSVGSPP